MSRSVRAITLGTFAELPECCRRCVFWELDPAAGLRAEADGSVELEKEAWLSDTLLEWGTCGQVAYVDGRAAGYVLYAPPAYVPRAASFPTSPASADALLLITGRLLPGYQGHGLGQLLVQTVIREAARRNIRAVEAFGRTGLPALTETLTLASAGSAHRCLLPADYLRAIGFKTVRAHPVTPRLRLDVRATASWREDVEYAFDRLLGSITGGVPAAVR